MQPDPKSLEKRCVCRVAERLSGRIRPQPQFQADRGEQYRRPFDREAFDPPPLDSAVLRRRDPDRARDVAPAQSPIQPALPKLPEDRFSEFSAPGGPDIDRSDSGSHRRMMPATAYLSVTERATPSVQAVRPMGMAGDAPGSAAGRPATSADAAGRRRPVIQSRYHGAHVRAPVRGSPAMPSWYSA